MFSMITLPSGQLVFQKKLVYDRLCGMFSMMTLPRVQLLLVQRLVDEFNQYMWSYRNSSGEGAHTKLCQTSP